MADLETAGKLGFASRLFLVTEEVTYGHTTVHVSVLVPFYSALGEGLL